MKKIYALIMLSVLLIARFTQASENKSLPIVYHPRYNVSFPPFDSMHPFDSKKYGKIFTYLVNEVGIDPAVFNTPKHVISDEDLLEIHSKEYLESLGSSKVIADIADMQELAWVPNFLLRWRMLTPMRYATQGTVDAAFLAIEHGWAINLAGGYHHAKADESVPESYCVYADIPLAIKKVHEKHPEWKVLIVDLDAHMGNGHEVICGPDERISILDFYNANIFAADDEEAKKYITYNNPIDPCTKDPMLLKQKPGIKDNEYLALLEEHLSKALEECKPDFIVYNAGTDIFKEDTEGRMSITRDGIIKRDALVFQKAREANVPTCMVLSGGYTMESASIISASIENLLKKVLKLPDDLGSYCNDTKVGSSLSLPIVVSAVGLAVLGYKYLF